MNIFSQIWVEQKLFNIHRNARKNCKNDKISNNTHFEIIL